MSVVSLPIYLFPTPAIPCAVACTPPPPITGIWFGPYATPTFSRAPELPPEIVYGVQFSPVPYINMQMNYPPAEKFVYPGMPPRR
jgi:hypothetical protein